MADYQISRQMQRIISLSRRFSIQDITTLSEEQVIELNNLSIPNNWITRKLLAKPTGHVDIKTFIIPVSHGAVTAYHFEPRNNWKDVIGVAPLIVFFHGGGWMMGNMDLYNFFCARLASETQAIVLSVDYRLAPKYKFPTAVEDCYATLEWAAEGARYWKADVDRIFVAGDSAGGNLAAVVSRLARDRKGPALAGQILLYPVTDGRMRTDSYTQYEDSPSLTRKEMAFYIQNYQREPKDILNPSFSPLLANDLSRLPPALVIGAQYDPLRDDGLLYAQALVQADTPARYLEVAHTVHGFINYPKATGALETESAIKQFVDGRPLEAIELITQKELRRNARKELRLARKTNKMYIEASSSED